FSPDGGRFACVDPVSPSRVVTLRDTTTGRTRATLKLIAGGQRRRERRRIGETQHVIPACGGVAVRGGAGLREVERETHPAARINARGGKNARAVAGGDVAGATDGAHVAVAAESRAPGHCHARR